MMLAAQIDSDNTVTAVIVCASIGWATATLGGTWVEANDDPAQPEKFAGIGSIYDPITGNFTQPPEPEPDQPIPEPTATKKRSRS